MLPSVPPDTSLVNFRPIDAASYSGITSATLGPTPREFDGEQGDSTQRAPVTPSSGRHRRRGLPGDVARIVAGEERDGGRNIFGIVDHRPIGIFAEICGDEFRRQGCDSAAVLVTPGTNRIHIDSERRQLLRERAGEADDAHLGGRVFGRP